MTEPVALLSEADPYSFCVPTFQFARQASIEQLAMDDRHKHNAEGYHSFSSGSACYLPRGHYGQLDANILDQPYVRTHEYHNVITLRSAAKHQPTYEGDVARNTCLMVEGKRSFCQKTYEKNQQNALYSYITRNGYECYGVWGRRHTDRPLGKPVLETNECRAFVGRSGCGVLYTRIPCFTSDFKVTGFISRLALIEFHILDGASNRDALLRYSIRTMQLRSRFPAEPDQAWNLHLQHLESVWIELAKRAYKGFISTSTHTVCYELDALAGAYAKQVQKSKADRHSPCGTSYRDSIKRMKEHNAFQEALDSVQEPWHLEVVIRQFDGPRFHAGKIERDTRKNRWKKMLTMYTCTEARRLRLNAMAQCFVAPRDSLWDDTGDRPKKAPRSP